MPRPADPEPVAAPGLRLSLALAPAETPRGRARPALGEASLARAFLDKTFPGLLAELVVVE